MKNKWRILCVSAALALVLSACGSTVTNDKESKEPEDVPIIEDEEGIEEGEAVKSL